MKPIGAVRWATVMDLAPYFQHCEPMSSAEYDVPMISRSLPVNSRASRKSWACRMRPLKVSNPGYSGAFGTEKWPDATITRSKVSELSVSATRSCAITVKSSVSASQVTRRTLVLKRMRSRTPAFSTRPLM